MKSRIFIASLAMFVVADMNHAFAQSDINWSLLGPGMNNWVETLAVSGGTLYAGGLFTTADGSAANYIAQWNGSSWSALGSGMNGEVVALAVSGDTLYVCGYFTTAGGSAANSIAQWNRSSWSALGSGVNGNVSALAVSGGILYAGGSFTTAGDSAAANIAQWNGSSWSPLGTGLGSVSGVSALAVSGDTLYAGGPTADHENGVIEQWNGSSWSPLGTGLQGYGYGFNLNALVALGGTLYAGGYFSTAGGGALNSIAQWNGSSWLPLGSGIGPVYAMTASGGTLYAGGDPGVIWQWNGSAWSSLGSGAGNGGAVLALAASGGALYADVNFLTNAYYDVAEAILSPPELPVIQSFNPSTGQLNITNLVSGQSCVIQSSTNLLDWVSVQTNPISAANQTIQLQVQPQASAYFYRLIEQP